MYTPRVDGARFTLPVTIPAAKSTNGSKDRIQEMLDAE